ncbi:TetR/AcrR family transcriptional regulator [Janthinobacterium sp. Mn2066]|uniref:TetR/AcrR family transcriptional regulator n=1 Tax=Janthinobacterium sp. Mn2066 TaxID=3395264 RepID=UPI003BD5306E
MIKVQESEKSAPPSLRKDARQNMERLRIAALDMFHERGLDVPLEEIAQRAGVSIGTLYNRFGTREALTDAVMADIAASRLGDAVTRARNCPDPWSRFACFVNLICEIQATEPALNDVISRRHPEASRLAAVCEETMAQARQFVDDAQSDGALRADFTLQELFLMFVSNGALMRIVDGAGAAAWRRCMGFMLDGLRVHAAEARRAGCTGV